MRSWASSLLVCLGVACAGNVASEEPSCELARGEALFSQCTVCHAIDPARGHGAAPNLYGVVGRPVGKKEGFKFSPALRRAEGTWTEAKLDAFLENPFGALPGSRMAFAGVPNPADRQALICFLAASGRTP